MEKNIIENKSHIERLAFFCDAVMAIAITLLALDLKLGKSDIDGLLTLSDLSSLIPRLIAFFLSFVVIAVVWTTHYQFFRYIVKIDSVIILANLVLLVFVVLLPVSASLISEYFDQRISTLIYSVNFLLLTLCINYIWDYLQKRPDYLDQKADNGVFNSITISCNVGVINGVLAVIAACFFPLLAFLMLLLRPFTTYFIKLYRFKR